MKPLHLIYIAAAAISIAHPRAAFAQGSLTPPGAPAPTMKRLDEVEPRVNLQAVPAPAGVDPTNANFHFVINQPGSYYLSANLGVTKPNGIQINAEGVTLDLNGFTILRASGTGGDGIQIAAPAHRANIVNGSLKGFAFGANALNADTGAHGSTFRNLTVTGCTSSAIFAALGASFDSCRFLDNTGTNGAACGWGCTLTNCSASNNSLVNVISAGMGSTLANCNVSYNNCVTGIFADSGSTLTNCTAFFGMSSAATSTGFTTGSGSTITACTAFLNSSSASLTSTTGIGFNVGMGSTIQHCTAYQNRGDGIRLAGLCIARDNSSSQNGSGGDAAGVHALNSRNRIEGNNVTGNTRGIDAQFGNVIVGNTARSNTVNYSLASGNVFGAIVDRTTANAAAVSGNSAASSIGTTDPWANVSY